MSRGVWEIMQRGWGSARIPGGREALRTLVLAIAAAAVGLLTAPSKASAIPFNYICNHSRSGCTPGESLFCSGSCDIVSGCQCTDFPMNRSLQ
jgi:hypothetical protein